MTFRAPVSDIAFSLVQVAGLGRLTGEGGFPDLDAELTQAVLEAAGQLSEDVLAPLNRVGDTVGARLENGQVIAPPGFRDAFKAFAEGGWNGLAADPEYGGQGLPRALHLAVFEMVHAANMALALAPTLTAGAIEALSAHGTAAQKTVVLPRLISGEWSGTMNLTEPQAGSDLGLVRTRAEPDGQGGWKLYGEKIFITWGDHDCADNIAHLVLARLPDAPAGVKGISLFLACKRRIDGQGNLLEANALKVGGIEHKLGIHGSPTCTMLFEGASAELVGEPNQGLAHMFTMMNAARLNVGAQGVGIAERALQQAQAYARERRQGRSPWSTEAPAPIFDHPDIRRRLMLTRARIEAARGICLTAGLCADLAVVAKDPAARDAARRREELLTPVAKAWATDLGVDAASEGVQVHGGMGFIEETGAAQHYRDARIAPIYEGTNAIQALDLAGRKLAADGGASVRELLADIRADLPRLDGSLAGFGARLGAGADAVEAATAWMLAGKGSPDGLAGASPFLKLFGDVTGGWMLAKGALADPDRAGLARLYGEHVLAGAPALTAAVQAGTEDLARFA
ncbi:MAG TPA: acyl-CoA dehydrogenase [Caulobacteraceae bacterium]|jgi:alkylation response protein AidB-like acyl-CoA dehydrogenase|nr:acyl-CoA dehydrogenase [Caulobacteraceae bacterium]